MAGGDLLGADAVGVLGQFAELQPGVADDAGIGRSPGRVLGDEVIDDPRELLLEVQDVEGDAQAVGDASGVVGVGLAAAALFAARGAARGRLPPSRAA